MAPQEQKFRGKWPPEKIGIFKAFWYFLSTPQALAIIRKILTMLGLGVSVVDEPLDPVPFLDILTIGDDSLWLIVPITIIVSTFRIKSAHNKAVQQYEERRAQLIRKRQFAQQQQYQARREQLIRERREQQARAQRTNMQAQQQQRQYLQRKRPQQMPS